VKFVILAVLSIVLAACQSFGPIAELTTQAQDEQIVGSQPRPMYWMRGEQLYSAQGETNLAVHLIELDSKQSLVIYSLSAPQDRDLKPIISETGRNNLANQETDLLLDLVTVQFFVSKFEPPHAKGTELHLVIQSPELGNGLDTQLTKQLEGIESRQPLTESDRESLAGIDEIEQGGYRISFNGFFLNTGDLRADQTKSKPRTQMEDVLADSESQKGKSAGPLPTKEPRKLYQKLLELSEGKPVRTDLTLRIENLKTKETKFLYIVTLDDGRVKAKIIE